MARKINAQIAFRLLGRAEPREAQGSPQQPNLYHETAEEEEH